MTTHILLLVEIAQRGQYCAGQWKDIQSLRQVLADLKHQFSYFEFDHRYMAQTLTLCKQKKATDIIVYYSFWPELLAKLKAELPNAKRYVRAVNAEALQHWQRSEIGFMPNYSNLRAIYGTLRLAWRDKQCKQLSDAVLGISEWDNRHYWSRLLGQSKILDVSYYSPWPHYRKKVLPKSWSQRSSHFICLAGGRDPIGKTMLKGFQTMANTLSTTKAFAHWQFLTSQGLLNKATKDPTSTSVKSLGFVDEPWDLLCSIKVLAVLTPLGFGNKTTIIDALAAGCHVLVHPLLAKRLPQTVRNLCIEYHNNIDLASFSTMLSNPPKSHDINHQLKNKMVHIFNDLFTH